MQNKTVLITWATSGIWKELVYKYIEEWYIVVATWRNTDKLTKLSKEINNKKIVYHKCDLTLDKDIWLLVDFLKSEDIFIDILINNAGVGIFKSFIKVSKKDINTMFYTNLLWHISLTQAILKQRSIKNICFISSLAWKVGFADLSVYSATKFAIEWFCDALREELISSNIKVTVIRPWIVDTSFFDDTDFIDYANQIRPKMQTSHLVADKTYLAIKEGYPEYTIGSDKYFLFLQKILPKLIHRRLLKLFIN